MDVLGCGLCSKGRWSLLQEKESVLWPKRLYAHTRQRKVGEEKEHHKQFSSSCPLRKRLVIVRWGESENDAQRSVGLRTEQQGLGGS